MPDAVTTEVHRFMQDVKRRNPHEREFHQAVQEVVESVAPFILEHKKYHDARILERMTEPDRIVIFRVTWEDDKGGVHANRAWRVQFNNAIGPYKGGMRFHPSVTLSVLKFLGFEQVFKNSLTGLPMGGGKGGSNFDPKGKSDREVMRFCQSLMIELHRHIGDNTDVPAGDIGVGGREVSYMFGQYKRMKNVWAGILTGKSLSYGGSLIRKEATGYGSVYFMEDMLATRGDGLKDKRCVVSGSGNVALYTIEKLNELGAKPIAASDSGGFIHDPDGIGPEKLEWLKALKEERRGRLAEYAEHFGCEYHDGKRPWSVPCDLAFPSATQNEISPDDAHDLVENGVIGVSEGANMPTTIDGVHTFLDAKVLYGPGKAANAGGVAVSGLEQSQNAQRITWSEEEVDQRLREIMQRIHRRCVYYGTENGGFVNYVKGANLAGFVKVADAMLAQGLV
ncbi:MAG: NADP-specific glutamate dehydrogenase [Gemmatimonadales bacterium]|nr:NADP-specific glutamate dehydrogenase [Gemmatimonadales bacterium]